MPYIVNGKTYTSYPLLDEIVYNCKLILGGIVVKNEYVALLYETEETLAEQEILFRCKLGTMTFEYMFLSADMLIEFGYDPSIVNQYVEDRNLIPEEDRDELLKFSMQYYIDHYVEKNKYYRSLMGLPEYGTDKYNVYLTPNDFPSDFDISTVDFSIPIHEQPYLVISVIKDNGVLDKLINNYRSFNYSYLRFLGDLSLDPYICRKAKKWDILYIPTVNSGIQFRFQELYDINRQIYLKRTYQNAYAFRSDYFDHILIFILLAQTFSDMINDAPEYFIRKDVFDIKTVQFFLEAYGVPYFDEIPLKYQIKIVKNINQLLKYKSTEQNFEDIINLFGLREIFLYRYYLYKKRRVDSEGHYVEDPDLNKKYELLFIEVLLGDTYDNYIKNLVYRNSYEEITSQDQYWDGTDDHDVVKQKILEKEFTIEPTKYLTIKADINYTEYQRQLIFLLGLIVDSRLNSKDLTVAINSISEGANFRLSDSLIFLELLNYLETELDITIRKPEDNNEEPSIIKPDFDPTIHVSDPDLWIRDYYPEFFINYNNRVFGFNPEANLTEISKVLARGYQSSLEKTFTLADFGCDTFIVPSSNIGSYEELLTIYETNMKCYDTLNSIICHGSNDELETLTAKYLFYQLFTKDFDYGLAINKTNLLEVLQDRNYMLWSFYNELALNTDITSRNKDIDAIINEIIINLEYYFDRDSLDYFFSFTSTSNFNSLTRYMTLVLNAFKSYKAHFIEPSVKYKFQHPDMLSGNYNEMNDEILNRDIKFSKFDKEFIHDYLIRTLFKYVEDEGRRKEYVEILDILDAFDPDPDDDYDYDGGTPATEDSSYTKVLDGTTMEMSLPYKTSDGGYSYGRHPFIRKVVDGKDVFYYDMGDDESTNNSTVLVLDGGKVTDDNSTIMNSEDFYFQKSFQRVYNGGTPNINDIINNNFFKRLYDYQDHQTMRIAARTGLEYSEDLSTGKAKLTEIWREWLSILEFESVQGDPELLNYLVEHGQFDEYYEQFLSDLNDGKIKIFLDEINQNKNTGLSLELTDAPTDSHRVIWIEDSQNQDTARVIEFNL